MNKWFLQRMGVLEMKEVSQTTYLRIMDPPVIQGPISKKVAEVAEYEQQYMVVLGNTAEVNIIADSPQDLVALMQSAISVMGDW